MLGSALIAVRLGTTGIDPGDCEEERGGEAAVAIVGGELTLGGEAVGGLTVPAMSMDSIMALPRMSSSCKCPLQTHRGVSGLGQHCEGG